MAVQTEYEGKTVDQALEIASRTLSIPVENIDYEVLDYGNSGFLGIFGVKKAKIKVLVSNKGSVSERNVSSLVDEAFASPKGKKKSNSVSGLKKPGTVEKKQEEKKKEVIKEKTPAPDVHVEQKEESCEEEEQVLFYTEDENSFEEAVDVSEEAIEKGRETLERILPLLVESFEIIPEVSGNELLYNLKADNPGVIIGKKGQNLESIQFLVDKIVNKVSQDRVRVLIDIEDYLERRKQNLHSMALRYAEKVKKSGKPATIGQLSAYERRFIHIALRDDRRVRTQSMGEGYYRKLVVFPSRRNKGKRRPLKRK